MTRAQTTHSHQPYEAKTKKNAHEELLQLKKANADVVRSGSGCKVKYRVAKLKHGYGIYYKNTGKWRSDK
jgi:hypothetical protein